MSPSKKKVLHANLLKQITAEKNHPTPNVLPFQTLHVPTCPRTTSTYLSPTDSQPARAKYLCTERQEQQVRHKLHSTRVAVMSGEHFHQKTNLKTSYGRGHLFLATPWQPLVSRFTPSLAASLSHRLPVPACRMRYGVQAREYIVRSVQRTGTMLGRVWFPLSLDEPRCLAADLVSATSVCCNS